MTRLPCPQLGDLVSAVELLTQCLSYVVETDAWGEDLLSAAVSRSPPLAALIEESSNPVNIGLHLLEVLATWLSMAVRDGWPAGQALPAPLAASLVSVLASIVGMSLAAHSRPLLDGVLTSYKGLRHRFPDGRLAVALLRAVAGLVCDPGLNPQVLLDYSNTRQTQAYATAVLEHLCLLLEDIQSLGPSQQEPPPDPNLAQTLGVESEHIQALVAALCSLVDVTEAKIGSYGCLLFPCTLALTYITVQVRRRIAQVLVPLA
jgi:hypothetical protein